MCDNFKPKVFIENLTLAYSQGSQGYESTGSDFVELESFTSIPDSSLPELNLQVSFKLF